jgi:16S rRNA G966 N2-methylase RsmD
MNTLYYGDHLHILREHIADESIDLIYLDPPFNSKRVYEARTMITDVNNSAEREKAQIGLFVTLTPPIKPMQKEAVSAGYYDSQFGAFPKIQNFDC